MTELSHSPFFLEEKNQRRNEIETDVDLKSVMEELN